MSVRAEEEAGLRTIPCSKPGKDGPCGLDAERVLFSRTLFKMKYGVAYAYASDSDRRAWLKRNDVQGWSQDQHSQYEKGGGLPKIKDKLS